MEKRAESHVSALVDDQHHPHHYAQPRANVCRDRPQEAPQLPLHQLTLSRSTTMPQQSALLTAKSVDSAVTVETLTHNEGSLAHGLSTPDTTTITNTHAGVGTGQLLTTATTSALDLIKQPYSSPAPRQSSLLAPNSTLLLSNCSAQTPFSHRSPHKHQRQRQQQQAEHCDHTPLENISEGMSSEALSSVSTTPPAKTCGKTKNDTLVAVASSVLPSLPPAPMPLVSGRQRNQHAPGLCEVIGDSTMPFVPTLPPPAALSPPITFASSLISAPAGFIEVFGETVPPPSTRLGKSPPHFCNRGCTNVSGGVEANAMVDTSLTQDDQQSEQQQQQQKQEQLLEAPLLTYTRACPQIQIASTAWKGESANRQTSDSSLVVPDTTANTTSLMHLQVFPVSEGVATSPIKAPMASKERFSVTTPLFTAQPAIMATTSTTRTNSIDSGSLHARSSISSSNAGMSCGAQGPQSLLLSPSFLTPLPSMTPPKLETLTQGETTEHGDETCVFHESTSFKSASERTAQRERGTSSLLLEQQQQRGHFSAISTPTRAHHHHHHHHHRHGAKTSCGHHGRLLSIHVNMNNGNHQEANAKVVGSEEKHRHPSFPGLLTEDGGGGRLRSASDPQQLKQRHRRHARRRRPHGESGRSSHVAHCGSAEDEFEQTSMTDSQPFSCYTGSATTNSRTASTSATSLIAYDSADHSTRTASWHGTSGKSFTAAVGGAGSSRTIKPSLEHSMEGFHNSEKGERQIREIERANVVAVVATTEENMEVADVQSGVAVASSDGGVVTPIPPCLLMVATNQDGAVNPRSLFADENNGGWNTACVPGAMESRAAMHHRDGSLNEQELRNDEALVSGRTLLSFSNVESLHLDSPDATSPIQANTSGQLPVGDATPITSINNPSLFSSISADASGQARFDATVVILAARSSGSQAIKSFTAGRRAPHCVKLCCKGSTTSPPGYSNINHSMSVLSLPTSIHHKNSKKRTSNNYSNLVDSSKLLQASGKRVWLSHSSLAVSDRGVDGVGSDVNTTMSASTGVGEVERGETAVLSLAHPFATNRSVPGATSTTIVADDADAAAAVATNEHALSSVTTAHTRSQRKPLTITATMTMTKTKKDDDGAFCSVHSSNKAIRRVARFFQCSSDGGLPMNQYNAEVLVDSPTAQTAFTTAASGGSNAKTEAARDAPSERNLSTFSPRCKTSNLTINHATTATSLQSVPDTSSVREDTAGPAFSMPALLPKPPASVFILPSEQMRLLTKTKLYAGQGELMVAISEFARKQHSDAGDDYREPFLPAGCTGFAIPAFSEMPPPISEVAQILLSEETERSMAQQQQEQQPATSHSTRQEEGSLHNNNNRRSSSHDVEKECEGQNRKEDTLSGVANPFVTPRIWKQHQGFLSVAALSRMQDTVMPAIQSAQQSSITDHVSRRQQRQRVRTFRSAVRPNARVAFSSLCEDASIFTAEAAATAGASNDRACISSDCRTRTEGTLRGGATATATASQNYHGREGLSRESANTKKVCAQAAETSMQHSRTEGNLRTNCTRDSVARMTAGDGPTTVTNASFLTVCNSGTAAAAQGDNWQLLPFDSRAMFSYFVNYNRSPSIAASLHSSNSGATFSGSSGQNPSCTHTESVATAMEDGSPRALPSRFSSLGSRTWTSAVRGHGAGEGLLGPTQRRLRRTLSSKSAMYPTASSLTFSASRGAAAGGVGYCQASSGGSNSGSPQNSRQHSTVSAHGSVRNDNSGIKRNDAGYGGGATHSESVLSRTASACFYRAVAAAAALNGNSGNSGQEAAASTATVSTSNTNSNGGTRRTVVVLLQGDGEAEDLIAPTHAGGQQQKWQRMEGDTEVKEEATKQQRRSNLCHAAASGSSSTTSSVVGDGVAAAGTGATATSSSYLDVGALHDVPCTHDSKLYSNGVVSLVSSPLLTHSSTGVHHRHHQAQHYPRYHHSINSKCNDAAGHDSYSSQHEGGAPQQDGIDDPIFPFPFVYSESILSHPSLYADSDSCDSSTSSFSRNHSQHRSAGSSTHDPPFPLLPSSILTAPFIREGTTEATCSVPSSLAPSCLLAHQHGVGDGHGGAGMPSPPLFLHQHSSTLTSNRSSSSSNSSNTSAAHSHLLSTHSQTSVGSSSTLASWGSMAAEGASKKGNSAESLVVHNVYQAHDETRHLASPLSSNPLNGIHAEQESGKENVDEREEREKDKMKEKRDLGQRQPRGDGQGLRRAPKLQTGKVTKPGEQGALLQVGTEVESSCMLSAKHSASFTYCSASSNLMVLREAPEANEEVALPISSQCADTTLVNEEDIAPQSPPFAGDREAKSALGSDAEMRVKEEDVMGALRQDSHEDDEERGTMIIPSLLYVPTRLANDPALKHLVDKARYYTLSPGAARVYRFPHQEQLTQHAATMENMRAHSPCTETSSFPLSSPLMTHKPGRSHHHNHEHEKSTHTPCRPVREASWHLLPTPPPHSLKSNLPSASHINHNQNAAATTTAAAIAIAGATASTEGLPPSPQPIPFPPQQHQVMMPNPRSGGGGGGFVFNGRFLFADTNGEMSLISCSPEVTEVAGGGGVANSSFCTISTMMTATSAGSASALDTVLGGAIKHTGMPTALSRSRSPSQQAQDSLPLPLPPQLPPQLEVANTTAATQAPYARVRDGSSSDSSTSCRARHSSTEAGRVGKEEELSLPTRNNGPMPTLTACSSSQHTSSLSGASIMTATITSGQLPGLHPRGSNSCSRSCSSSRDCRRTSAQQQSPLGFAFAQHLAHFHRLPSRCSRTGSWCGSPEMNERLHCSMLSNSQGCATAALADNPPCLCECRVLTEGHKEPSFNKAEQKDEGSGSRCRSRGKKDTKNEGGDGADGPNTCSDDVLLPRGCQMTSLQRELIMKGVAVAEPPRRHASLPQQLQQQPFQEPQASSNCTPTCHCSEAATADRVMEALAITSMHVSSSVNRSGTAARGGLRGPAVAKAVRADSATASPSTAKDLSTIQTSPLPTCTVGPVLPLLGASGAVPAAATNITSSTLEGEPDGACEGGSSDGRLGEDTMSAGNTRVVAAGLPFTGFSYSGFNAFLSSKQAGNTKGEVNTCSHCGGTAFPPQPPRSSLTPALSGSNVRDALPPLQEQQQPLQAGVAQGDSCPPLDISVPTCSAGRRQNSLAFPDAPSGRRIGAGLPLFSPPSAPFNMFTVRLGQQQQQQRASLQEGSPLCVEEANNDDVAEGIERKAGAGSSNHNNNNSASPDA